ncbi:hypothetical protein F5X68DRAFT_200452 [Plectosphaerella plurivora]|uniref:C2H2-type domain-containing protein n=1 Tax=Plectosphaerella plurivora TaxID=936078 RepID=A0A9P8VJ66_9PEZI|nr:hypothetical protein F5X68DRAFT_200452 [Plectosphaerella plurivora]
MASPPPGDVPRGAPLVMPVPSRHHREPRHLKTPSAGSIASGPFPPIDEAFEQHSFGMGMGMKQHPRGPLDLDLALSSAALRAYRDRSPTSSTMSSSVVAPDSATIYSMPMSPTSSTFTRATTPDVELDLDLAGIQGQQVPDAVKRHRKRVSLSSLFRFLNHGGDRDEMPSPVTPSGPSDEMQIHMPMPQARTPRALEDPEDHEDLSDKEDTPAVNHHTYARNTITPESLAEIPPLKPRFSFDTSTADSPSPAPAPISTSPEPPLVDVDRDDADALLSYVLQSAYGVDLDEIGARPTLLRHMAARFIHDVGRIAFAGPPPTQLAHAPSTASGSSSNVALSRHASSNTASSGGSKRKKAGGGSGSDPGDTPSDAEGDGDDNHHSAIKRPRPTPREPDENLRLACPFRRRNPSRFNVRQHHSCAMTYFPKFAELRQHIVKQHRRAGPTAFPCDRCSRDFESRKALRDHQRLPRELMCEIADHDPESGIDGAAATKLLSRKRASGTSPEVQWGEIWHLLFPDDEEQDVQPWDFCPVIEHFEITDRFIAGLAELEDSLRNKGLSEPVLETIGNLYRNRLIQVVEQCVGDARARPYSNRSNRRSGDAPASSGPPKAGLLFGRAAPRPDSGVDLDEGSSEGDAVSSAAGASWSYGLALEDVRGLRRSPSTATEVRVGSGIVGSGGRMLMPLVEQQCFTGVEESYYAGVGQGQGQGQDMDAWGVDGSAMVSGVPMWTGADGYSVPVMDAGVLPTGLTYPGWDGMYDFSAGVQR